MLQSTYMNNTVPIAIKSELDEIKNEVRGLKSLVTKLVKLNTRIVERIKDTDTLDYSEITPEELMTEASRVFHVTSSYDPDDDLISPAAKVKPIDWSEYA
jgi:hypothetical protein